MCIIILDFITCKKVAICARNGTQFYVLILNLSLTVNKFRCLLIKGFILTVRYLKNLLKIVAFSTFATGKIF